MHYRGTQINLRVCFSTSFLNNFNLCSYLKTKNQVSQPYNQQVILVLYILIFNWVQEQVLKPNHKQFMIIFGTLDWTQEDT
jgi:hypothetical protein